MLYFPSHIELHDYRRLVGMWQTLLDYSRTHDDFEDE